MSPLRAGVLLAALVAGWPLYALVQAGSMDGDTALTRGLVVAVGCALGVTALLRLAAGYERDAERARRVAEAEQGVVHEGTLLHGEGRPPGEGRPTGESRPTS